MLPQAVTTAPIQRVLHPPLSLATPRGPTALQKMLLALTRTKFKPVMERPRSLYTEGSVSRKRKAQRVRQDLRKKRPGWLPMQPQCIPRLNLRTWTWRPERFRSRWSLTSGREEKREIMVRGTVNSTQIMTPAPPAVLTRMWKQSPKDRGVFSVFTVMSVYMTAVDKNRDLFTFFEYDMYVMLWASAEYSPRTSLHCSTHQALCWCPHPSKHNTTSSRCSSGLQTSHLWLVSASGWSI